jgi:polyhydroxybutyrate depolymerase
MRTRMPHRFFARFFAPRGFNVTRRALAAVVVVLGIASGCRTPLAEFEHQGRTRHYLLHEPPNRTGPVPLLVVMHGGGGNPRQVARYTGFDAVADRFGFAVVYPGALVENWNDGRDAAGIDEQRDDVDDVGFLVALVDKLVARKAIDRARVYATGISNGALMSYRLACERADVFAAIAPVVGALPAPLAQTCAPSHPIAVLAMNGTDDTFIPIGGGDVVGMGQRGRVLSVDDTLALFAAKNGCTGGSTMVASNAVADDRTTLETTTWAGCRSGGETRALRFIGGGHTLPGVDGRPHEPFIGVTSQEVDGPNAIWRFVSQFRRE